MKRVFTLLYGLYLGTFSIGYSQSTPPPDDYLPPTPTVAALGKYVDAPVSLYTGTPEISIPIYEINCRGFKLPISLSYHAGGFRVEEESSWIGLGWSLDATGVITRSIRHRLDNSVRDSFFSTYTGGLLDPNGTSSYTTLMMIEDHPTFDGFPDMFTYNFTGHSGKFVYMNSTVTMLPKKPVLITKETNGWQAIDEAGVIYHFTEVESAATRGGSTGSLNDISWYLSQIITPKGDEITFEYKDTEFYEPVNLSQTDNYKLVSGHYDFQNTTTDGFTTTQYGKELHKIIFPQGEIEFISSYSRDDIDKPVGAVGALKLTGIKVKDKDETVIKEFTLDQSYFTASSTNTPANKRLKLNALMEEEVPNTYFFEYNTGVNLPAKTSKAQDHWGYFNNKTTNTSLIPPLADNVTAALEPTREPNPATTKACLLTKITYPTGGYTQYEYQGHDYGYINNQAIASWQEKVNVNNYLDVVYAYTNRSELSPTTRETQTSYLTIPRDQTVRLTIDIEYPDTYVVGQASLAIIEFYSAPEPGAPETLLETYTINENGSHFVELTAGRYKLHAIGTMNRGLAHAALEYQDYDLVTYKSKYTGGARVSRITEHDGFNPDIIRSFTYKMSDDPTRSSGSLLQQPVYLKTYSTYDQVDYPCVYNEIRMLGVRSESKYPLGSGNHIGYREVQVQYGNGGENGKSISTFTTNGNLAGGVNSDISWERGLLLTRTDYNASGQKLRFLQNEYDHYGYQQYYGLVVNAISKHPCAPETGPPSSAAPVDFEQTQSVMASELYALKKQTTEDYSGTNKVTNITEYSYDNLTHLQPTRTVKQTNTKRIITGTLYPDDFTDNTGFIHSLKDNHVIVPIESVTWQESLSGTNPEIISGQLFLYKTGGKGLLEETKQLELTSPLAAGSFRFSNYTTAGVLPPSGTANDFSAYTGYRSKVAFLYDNDNNPKQILPDKGAPISYIWGYQKLFPIAKAVNAAHDRIAYTGFENNDEGNWNTYTANTSVARTGSKGYIGTLSKSGLTSGDYSITLWVKDGSGTPSIASLTPTYTSSPINGWRLMKWQATLSGTLTINSNGSTIDDVRLSPVGSMMTTLTYDPIKGPTSVTDPNNTVSFYEYDEFGRLKDTRDTKGNVLQSYQYHYQQ